MILKNVKIAKITVSRESEDVTLVLVIPKLGTYPEIPEPLKLLSAAQTFAYPVDIDVQTIYYSGIGERVDDIPTDSK